MLVMSQHLNNNSILLEAMPNYKQKLTNPLTNEEFIKGMKDGHFVRKPQHVGLIAFLHYSAVRISEGLAMKREQFRITPSLLFCDIGIRLKGSKSTPPLEIPVDAAFVESIIDSIRATKKEKAVWPYHRSTGWRIVKRVFAYPHYHRLTRITQFFLDGYTIPEVRSWTGLSLRALDYYIGLVSISKMGKSLRQKRKSGF